MGRAQEVTPGPPPGPTHVQAWARVCTRLPHSRSRLGKMPSPTPSSSCQVPNTQEPSGTGSGWGLPPKALLLCSLAFVPPCLLQTLVLGRGLRPPTSAARPGHAQPSPQSHINQGCATAAAGLEPGLGGREQPAVSSSQGRLGCKNKRVLGPQEARPGQALASTASPGGQAPGRVSLQIGMGRWSFGPRIPGQSISHWPHCLFCTDRDMHPSMICVLNPRGLERRTKHTNTLVISTQLLQGRGARRQ